MRDDSMIVFQDVGSGERVYCPICRRGNRQYALKKAEQRDTFSDSIQDKVLDVPVGSNPNHRRTCAFLITLTFDKKRFTREQAWA